MALRKQDGALILKGGILACSCCEIPLFCDLTCLEFATINITGWLGINSCTEEGGLGTSTFDWDYTGLNGSYTTSDVTGDESSASMVWHLGTYGDPGDRGIKIIQSTLVFNEIYGGGTEIMEWYVYKITSTATCGIEDGQLRVCFNGASTGYGGSGHIYAIHAHRFIDDEFLLLSDHQDGVIPHEDIAGGEGCDSRVAASPCGETYSFSSPLNYGDVRCFGDPDPIWVLESPTVSFEL